MKGVLDLELTRRCNLRCDYCFVGWSRDWHSDMPLDVALAIVGEGAASFPALHITGGEPFAYRGLSDVLDAAERAGYEEILINTNGTMLTRDVAEGIAARGRRVSISVSLDGPAPIHDAARGPGRFEEASEGLKRALACGVRASVMTVVTPEVLGELVPFLDRLFADHPALAGVTLFPVGVGPEGSQKPGASLRSLNADELRELAFTVALLFRAGRALGVGAYPIVNPLLLAFGYPASMLYQCGAGRGRACVHADLTVSTCHPVKEPVYGSYRPGLLAAIGAAAVHRRMAERDYEGCGSCEHKEACGHCRAYVTAAGEPFFGNDGACRDLVPFSAGARPIKRVSLPVI